VELEESVGIPEELFENADGSVDTGEDNTMDIN
jgi:hypothetical protein